PHPKARPTPRNPPHAWRTLQRRPRRGGRASARRSASANTRGEVARRARRTLTSRPVQAIPTRLAGLVAFEPVRHGDERGFFCETYRREWQAPEGRSEERRVGKEGRLRWGACHWTVE